MKFKQIKYLFIISIIAFAAACSSDDDEVVPKPKPNPTDPVDPTTPTVLLPKKDMRAVWFTTVWELDWPMSDYSEAGQKKKYIDYLDKLVENNFNTIFVQVRSMADSFYDSPYEPWSKVITGTRGKAPNYDVLQFMLDEAHARGLEFHAWINPYRISTNSAEFNDLEKYGIDPKLVKTYSSIQMYNPALPEAQDLIVNVVKDIITKYDVDGIAFDDYFYPEGVGSFNDDDEFKKYGAAFTSIESFRRDNVNKVIKRVQEVIAKEKPDAVFSVSPAANITKNYQTLYADIQLWCKEGWVDIIIPQLYFATGSATGSFNNYLTQWERSVSDVPLMIAYPLYKFGDPDFGTAFQSSAELQKQFDYASKSAKTVGGVMYSTKHLNSNPVNIMSVIKKVYEAPALIPFAGRKTLPDPIVPKDVKLSNGALTWTPVSDLQYAIYKDQGEKKVAKLIAITTKGSYELKEKGTYFITSVNKDNVESAISDRVTYN